MTPKEIVTKMLEKDAFSAWLQLEMIEIDLGYCKTKMQITAQMLNGFGIVHGGIINAFADSALAFAANSLGDICVTQNVNTHFFKGASLSDFLIAEAKVLNESTKNIFVQVVVANQMNERIAHLSASFYKLTPHTKTV